jgi:hypothetical protein
MNNEVVGICKEKRNVYLPALMMKLPNHLYVLIFVQANPLLQSYRDHNQKSLEL